MKKIIPALLFSSLLTLSAAPAAANIWTARETGNYYELITPSLKATTRTSKRPLTPTSTPALPAPPTPAAADTPQVFVTS